MPPKKKDFLKPNAKAKAKSQEPQTENDFLEAADEFEQAAGKWRAGDAAKATRFFNRAIDMYNAGLQKYPRSFDLAYNKANLEYNMTEDPRIVSALGSKIILLEETLLSHRLAATLDEENTDVLFNTAQVLTSLAEALLEQGTQETAKAPSRGLLEEAVALFTKCIASQQQEYEQTQTEFAHAQLEQESEGGVALEREESQDQDGMETSSTSSDAPGQWATVLEPVTAETILETCTAQLGALTSLLGLYDPSDLAIVEERVQMGLDTADNKTPVLMGLIQDKTSIDAEELTPGPTLSIGSASTPEDVKTTAKDDALLAVASFKATIAEVVYRNGQSDANQLASQIENVFAPLTNNSPADNSFDAAFANVLSSYSDALIDLASAISDSPNYTTSSPDLLSNLDTQWTALTTAQANLTKLSSPPCNTSLSASRLADIYLARGDSDLFRFRISLFSVAKAAWVKSKPVLLGNAGVFYRGARTYAEKAGALDVHKTADAKAIVAEVLKEALGGSGEKKAQWKGKQEDVVKALEQMVEEGIVGSEDAEGVMLSLQQGLPLHSISGIRYILQIQGGVAS
ncbi:hypothetical protein BDV96DRAFT_652057 [Lophiotrema nucula]|uniref:Uncharacterized protein n=1 Tax=Lophiotrema nucula TaxID=690887 RepID=A0A6A5YQC4_9PLEO|nr:hypothetical protein BDV96DRAFT_652057 [Lophiotrema nucula]